MNRRIALTLWVLLFPCGLALFSVLLVKNNSSNYYPWVTDVAIAALALVALLVPTRYRGSSRRL